MISPSTATSVRETGQWTPELGDERGAPARGADRVRLTASTLSVEQDDPPALGERAVRRP
jgi:hypothetical protein